LLAVGLAMDATAVAAARGLAAKRVRIGDSLLVGALFGGFQAGMPALGWLLGDVLSSRIMGWGHWVTFVVLGGIGAKMIYEATRPAGRGEGDSSSSRAGDTNGASPFGLKVLALLAVATSIDALAAGITLAVSGVPIVTACVVIGVITAVLSLGGVHAGHRFGARFGKRLEILGGVVLVGLAVKALVDHFRG